MRYSLLPDVWKGIVSMGVYINMEMPKGNDAVSVIIFPNGKVSLAHDRRFAEYAEAVPVPPHGDLVDRDVLKKQGYFFPCAIGTEYTIPLRALREAPAVIPAEPCNNLSKPCKEGEAK